MSQPPVTLLLGLLGLVALGLAVWGGVRRGADAAPRRGLEVAELRFGVLLAACFALPLVAFALLRPVIYSAVAGGIFISCTGLFACWRPSP